MDKREPQCRLSRPALHQRGVGPGIANRAFLLEEPDAHRRKSSLEDDAVRVIRIETPQHAGQPAPPSRDDGSCHGPLVVGRPGFSAYLNATAAAAAAADVVLAAVASIASPSSQRLCRKYLPARLRRPTASLLVRLPVRLPPVLLSIGNRTLHLRAHSLETSVGHALDLELSETEAPFPAGPRNLQHAPAAQLVIVELKDLARATVRKDDGHAIAYQGQWWRAGVGLISICADR